MDAAKYESNGCRERFRPFWANELIRAICPGPSRDYAPAVIIVSVPLRGYYVLISLLVSAIASATSFLRTARSMSSSVLM